MTDRLGDSHVEQRLETATSTEHLTLTVRALAQS